MPLNLRDMLMGYNRYGDPLGGPSPEELIRQTKKAREDFIGRGKGGDPEGAAAAKQETAIPFRTGTPPLPPGLPPAEGPPPAVPAPTSRFDEGAANLAKALGITPDEVKSRAAAIDPGWAAKPGEQLKPMPGISTAYAVGLDGTAAPAAPQGLLAHPLAPLFASKYQTLGSYNGNVSPTGMTQADVDAAVRGGKDWAQEMMRQNTARAEQTLLQQDIDNLTGRDKGLDLLGSVMRDQGEGSRAQAALAQQKELAGMRDAREAKGQQLDALKAMMAFENQDKGLSSQSLTALMSSAAQAGRPMTPADAALAAQSMRAAQDAYRGTSGRASMASQLQSLFPELGGGAGGATPVVPEAKGPQPGVLPGLETNLTPEQMMVAQKLQGKFTPGMDREKMFGAFPGAIGAFSDQELANPAIFNALLSRLRQQTGTAFDQWSQTRNAMPSAVPGIFGGKGEDVQQLRRMEAAYKSLGGADRGENSNFAKKAVASLGAAALTKSGQGLGAKAVIGGGLKRALPLYGLFEGGKALGDLIWGQ